MKTEEEMTNEELCKLARLYKAKAELLKEEIEIQKEINKIYRVIEDE